MAQKKLTATQQAALELIAASGGTVVLPYKGRGAMRVDVAIRLHFMGLLDWTRTNTANVFQLRNTTTGGA